jgi:hypothetical protein
MAQAKTDEHFIIHVGSVSKERVGDLMSLLAREAFFDVRPELVTTVVTYNKKTQHDVKAEDFLIDWIADHPTFKAIEPIQHFREAGRTDGACYTALRMLCQRKLLHKLGDGMYSRADVKALPKPKQAAAKASKSKPAAKREVDHRTFVLRTASRNHGRFNTAWMKKQFVADGRSPGNVSPTISALLKTKQLKRTADSEYVLPQKAAPPKKPVEKPVTAKVNGFTDPVAAAQEILHG